MDAVIFDLDNTLYPAERPVFALIDQRINRYMREVVAIPERQVDSLRRQYWRAYGATLQGLIRHYGVDPEDYLEYVHDVDLSFCLQQDEDLRCCLASLPTRRCVFTNGSRGHAENVLAALGLADSFEEIFDIRIAAYRPKPHPDPYLEVLDKLALPAPRCVMVEDSLDNLATAKRLGMTTVLVGSAAAADFVDHRVADATGAARLIHSWL